MRSSSQMRLREKHTTLGVHFDRINIRKCEMEG